MSTTNTTKLKHIKKKNNQTKLKNKQKMKLLTMEFTPLSLYQLLFTTLLLSINYYKSHSFTIHLPVQKRSQVSFFSHYLNLSNRNNNRKNQSPFILQALHNLSNDDNENDHENENDNNNASIRFLGKGNRAVVRPGVVLVAPKHEYSHWL